MARLAARIVCRGRGARKQPAARIWETDYTPNATGTAAAYRPAGALEQGGKRAAATGDYEPWLPDA